MGTKSYREKLLDPRWQKLRLQVLERDGWACRACEDKDSTLHVHHGYYPKGGDPWDAEQSVLWTLCEACHDELGRQREAVLAALGAITPNALEDLMPLLVAVRALCCHPRGARLSTALEAFVRLLNDAAAQPSEDWVDGALLDLARWLTTFASGREAESARVAAVAARQAAIRASS